MPQRDTAMFLDAARWLDRTTGGAVAFGFLLLSFLGLAGLALIFPED